MQEIDLTSKIFGLLTVKTKSDKRLSDRISWVCICECGNEHVVTGKSLQKGSTKSCGCLKNYIVDLSGQRFNHLTAISYVEGKKSCWQCVCDCGNYIIVRTDSLQNGHTKSCGCLKSANVNKLVGKRFGRLVVDSIIRHVNHSRNSLHCICDCGNTCDLEVNNLISGRTQSCGCYCLDYPSNWRGGLTDENHTIRASKEMQVWRKAVFERDDFICQKCGIRGGFLHAHHIKGFAKYPELRFELDNGLTLCKECHYEVHRKTLK